MALWTNDAVQLINPGEDAVFTLNPVPCRRGFIRHRAGTGSFLLAGKVCRNSCGCFPNSANYLVDFGANISIPTGGTVGAITVAITIDGSTIPASTMEVTPAAVEEYFNVSREINADIWAGCCETVTIRNTSDQPIQMKNASIDISRPDLAVTR